MRLFVSTVPFAEADPAPRRMLAEAGLAVTVNPTGRRLQPQEVAAAFQGFDVIIAGTEQINAEVIDACPQLKAICRVGTGLDSVDLQVAETRGVAVSYTPDAPAPAVAELSIGLMLDLLRGISASDRAIRAGVWHRQAGRRLATQTVGVVGAGRIGARVLRHLAGGFPGVRLLAHDIAPDPGLLPEVVRWVDFPEILAEADIVSLHLPLTERTLGLIGAAELATMKPGALLINTARGGIVEEAALADALTSGRLGGAALDVFTVEPYSGPLTGCQGLVLTTHLGSMTRDCRAAMEIEATAEAIRFAQGQPLMSPVPDNERASAALLRARCIAVTA